MKRLNPDKLHVTYLADATPDELIVSRRYTLTHSDMTGELFLSIGGEFNNQQISKLYTRLMRDEVLAEICYEGNRLVFRVYCRVSGGLVLGRAKWRYNIFRAELPLALKAIRYGDRALFKQSKELDQIPVHVYFQSSDKRFNKVEHWGVIANYGQ